MSKSKKDGAHKFEFVDSNPTNEGDNMNSEFLIDVPLDGLLYSIIDFFCGCRRGD
jgi:hypothetical protein